MSVDVTVIYSFFVVLLSAIFLNRALFVPIGKVLDDRAARLKDDDAERASALSSLESRVTDYNARIAAAKRRAFERREVIRGQASAAKGELLQKAREEAEAALRAGKQEIATASTVARGQLKGESERLAVQMASRILGRPLGGAA